MKFVALALTFLGVICLLSGAIWDTTPTGYVNFHAVSQQQTLLLLGGFTFLGGLVLLGFERARSSSRNHNPTTGQATGASESTGSILSTGRQLRLAVGVSVGVPIAYFFYRITPGYISYLPPIITIIVAIILSVIPGATGRRLKQMFLLSAAVLGILVVVELRWIGFLLELDIMSLGDSIHLILITALCGGCLLCLAFVDQWVARLPDERPAI